MERVPSCSSPPSSSPSSTAPRLPASSLGQSSVRSPLPSSTLAPDAYEGKTVYDFQVLNCYHELYDLSQHRGRPLLICNVASQCKEYSQSGYETLMTLYNRYHDHGVGVLAFPCNQFGGAEPGEADEVAAGIAQRYPELGPVLFPVMAKIDVNGQNELPLYGYLKRCLKGSLNQAAIKWNFTFFIINGEGRPEWRFPPGTRTEVMEGKINELLGFVPPDNQTSTEGVGGATSGSFSSMGDKRGEPQDTIGDMVGLEETVPSLDPCCAVPSRPFVLNGEGGADSPSKESEHDEGT